ncbi:MAG: AraC family transcriptional regulator [Pseudomonadota bacterium]
MFERSEPVQDPLHHNVIPIQSVLANGDLEAWQRVSAPFCSIQPLNSARMQAENDISVTRVGAIGLFGGACGGHLLRRSHVNLSDTPGFVLITRYEAGCLTGMMNDTAFSVQAGDLVLRDLDSRFEALRCPSRFEAVLVPRQMLGLEMGQVPDLRILQRDDPAVQDMRNIMQEAFKASRGGTSIFSFGLMQRLLTMVRAILLMPQRGLSPRRAARQSQLRQILHFIELNLGRLDLSAETLLPEFGLSRATLYRLFEPQGGVRNYIVNRRLFRALLEIADAPSRRGKIQLAAKRWGFSSPSNFNRSVQHVFGASPGALLRKPLKRELPTSPMTQIAHADVLPTR